MIRYEDCTSDVSDLAREIQAEFFPELRNIKIKFLFDLKKRSSNGRLVLARCQKANDLIKHFTIDEAGGDEGYDYIIYIDKVVWDNIERADRIRLVRHEMRHILIDDEAKNPIKLCDHDVNDFAEEIELNRDDTRWATRVADLGVQIYEQQADQEAE